MSMQSICPCSEAWLTCRAALADGALSRHRHPWHCAGVAGGPLIGRDDAPLTLSDEPRHAASRTLRIALDYTDAEVLAHRAIVARAAPPSAPRHLSVGVVGMGFLAALVFAWLADQAGAIRGNGGAVVAGLSFLGFWLGVWATSIWAWRFNQRQARAMEDQARRQRHGAVCLVSDRGLSVRLPGSRMFFPRSSIARVTAEQGLMLIWPTADIDWQPILAVPLRLLTPAQQAMLSSCAPQHPGASGDPEAGAAA